MAVGKVSGPRSGQRGRGGKAGTAVTPELWRVGPLLPATHPPDRPAVALNADAKAHRRHGGARVDERWALAVRMRHTARVGRSGSCGRRGARGHGAGAWVGWLGG